MGSESVIEAESLGFSFPGKPIIDSLSFTVRAGSFITFLGPFRVRKDDASQPDRRDLSSRQR